MSICGDKLMKKIVLYLLIVSFPLPVSSQTVALNRTVSFSYDLSGNIISRKGQSFPSKPIDGNNRIDISGDISIIGKDNKFTIDLKKDYGTTATLQVSDLSPVVVKSAEFTKQTYTVDMNDSPSGVYIFNVKVAGSEATRKVIKD